MRNRGEEKGGGVRKFTELRSSAMEMVSVARVILAKKLMDGW